MTLQRYIKAKFLKTVGISKKQQRLQHAAHEMQLLSDAEEILGRNVWQNVQHIEQYQEHYQSINNLNEEKNGILEKISDIDTKVSQFKQSQAEKFKLVSNFTSQKEAYQLQQIKVDGIIADIEDINKVANNIKKSFNLAKQKIQEISGSESEAEISKTQAKIDRLKAKFTELKEKKILSDQRLTEEKTILKKLENFQDDSKTNYKDAAASNYQLMEKARNALASYRNQVGILDNKIISHYKEIGKNISVEYFTNSQCKAAAKEKHHLCKIIKSLRKSIAYNNILAER